MEDKTTNAVAVPANKNNLDVRNSDRAVALREQLSAIPISRETGITIANAGQATILADLFVKGGYAPKGASTEYATVAILHGSLLGLNPIQSIQSIAVVNGRPTLYGDGMAAVVKSSAIFAGEKVEYFGGGDEGGCRFTVLRRLPDGGTCETVEQFTVADAKRAGLWDKVGPWKTNPRQMLFNRARAFAYRHAFPDLLQGIRSFEEERDIIDVTPAREAPKPEPVDAKAVSRLRQSLRLPGTAPAVDTAEAPAGVKVGGDKEANPAAL